MDATLGVASYSLSIDYFQNVYIEGNFLGICSFDSGAATHNIVSSGRSDVFVARLDTAGNFKWVKTFGGTDDEFGTAAAADNNGGVVITGEFTATCDFDPGTGVCNFIKEGSELYNTFLCRLDSSGNLTWAKSYDAMFGKAVAVNGNGNIFVSGDFGTMPTVDFDPGPEAFMLTSHGNFDVYVSEFTRSGNFVTAYCFGGGSGASCYSMAVDQDNNIYTCGTFSGSVDFDPSNEDYSLSSRGSEDIFVHKMGRGYLSTANSMSLTEVCSVYPNPATNELSVTGIPTATNYRILTVTGNSVQTGLLPKGSCTIVLPNISAGMYILEMTSSDGKNVIHFIKR